MSRSGRVYNLMLCFLKERGLGRSSDLYRIIRD